MDKTEGHNVDHGEVLQRTFVPSSIVSDTTTLELKHRMTDVESLNPLHRLRSRGTILIYTIILYQISSWEFKLNQFDHDILY